MARVAPFDAACGLTLSGSVRLLLRRRHAGKRARCGRRTMLAACVAAAVGYSRGGGRHNVHRLPLWSAVLHTVTSGM